MMPMLPFQPPPSVLNAYARVDKATSEFLNSPDWRTNIGICDTLNTKPWLAKEFIRAVRCRLQHKNPNVKLLSLTLLETIVKNCSDHIHVQMLERKVLHEMVKIVKKTAHMRVREKTLMLIDTWQEAFGSRGAKTTTQYYRAYEELRRSGVAFPQRSPDSVPIITPPANQAGVGPSTRHEPTHNLSLSALESMRNVLDLLSEMLQEIGPKDRKALNDEIIVDLYNQCRSNQKKVGETLSSTNDEEILCQGIQFNEAVQHIIEKHDAIASGSPVPLTPPKFMTNKTRGKQIENTHDNLKSSIRASSPTLNPSVSQEPENLARVMSRHIEAQSENDKKPVSEPSIEMALVPSDPLPSTKQKAIEEDLIDLLTLALPSTSTPDQTPPVVETQQSMGPSYVVPWAQAQTQAQPEYSPVQTIEQQSNYIPPPWAPTPGYYCNPYASNYSPASYYNNGSASGSGYIPSYRLFEDLNVLGNVRTGGTPGATPQSMLGARK